MSYQLIYRDAGFIIRFFGHTSIDDLNQGNGEIQGHEEFDTHRYQIVDFREADLSGISLDSAQEPAVMDVIASSTNIYVRIALVPSDSHSFILCKEFAEQSLTLGSPWEYAIFYNYDEALEWAKGRHSRGILD